MNDFAQKLIEWHRQHPRPMPWQGERDAYRIWLSEIILQQTRVQQGLPYYLKLIEKYPTVHHLACARLEEVLKLWQGLGYYSRCRHLHATAQYIVKHYGGKFPNDFATLRQLKGIGNYTAAAIASFAFDLPHAVLDGNVLRILARLQGIKIAIDTTEGKQYFAELAQRMMGDAPPALYNQAIMNFGAIQCLPQQPDCCRCPFHADCFAFQQKKVKEFPVKMKNLQRQRRYFLYFDIQHGGRTWLRQRTEKDIWQGLYEFPNREILQLPDDTIHLKDTIAHHFFNGDTQAFTVENISQPFRQILTHREIIAVFVKIRATLRPQFKTCQTHSGQNYVEVNLAELKKVYPIPKIIDTYLSSNVLHLRL